MLTIQISIERLVLVSALLASTTLSYGDAPVTKTPQLVQELQIIMAGLSDIAERVDPDKLRHHGGQQWQGMACHSPPTNSNYIPRGNLDQPTTLSPEKLKRAIKIIQFANEQNLVAGQSAFIPAGRHPGCKKGRHCNDWC